MIIPKTIYNSNNKFHLLTSYCSQQQKKNSYLHMHIYTHREITGKITRKSHNPMGNFLCKEKEKMKKILFFIFPPLPHWCFS